VAFYSNTACILCSCRFSLFNYILPWLAIF